MKNDSTKDTIKKLNKRLEYWPDAWEMQRKQLKFSIPIIKKRGHKMKYYLQEARFLPING